MAIKYNDYKKDSCKMNGMFGGMKYKWEPFLPSGVQYSEGAHIERRKQATHAFFII